VHNTINFKNNGGTNYGDQIGIGQQSIIYADYDVDFEEDD
jgi:hypothetical protein